MPAGAGTGIIIVSAALIALLLGAAGKKRPPFDKPIPLPQNPADFRLIQVALCEIYDELGPTEDREKLWLALAKKMHPDVPWPPGPKDHQTVLDAWEIFGNAVDSLLALTDDERELTCLNLLDPCPNGMQRDPVTLQCVPIGAPKNPAIGFLEVWLSDDPVPGKLYQIQKNDNMSNIARRALDSVIDGAGDSDGNRLAYIKCISSGPAWNMPLYASTHFSKIYPAMYGVGGRGVARAFMPWHQDAVKAILERRFPNRQITDDGARIVGGGSYGLPWLPPIDPEALAIGQVTCAPFNWEDGSSSINPPPELFMLIGEGG